MAHTKTTFTDLLQTIEAEMTAKKGNRGLPLTAKQKLCIFLNVVASNSFQIHAGDVFCVHQSTVSRCFHEILDILFELRSQFIYWPDDDEQERIAAALYTKSGIPGLVGALDGSLVKIQAPRESEHEYVCRKGFHAINFAAIVDDRFLFRWVFAEHPGWPRLLGFGTNRYLSINCKRRPNDFTLTPILRPANRSELNYSDAVCKGRVIVEQAFGHLKRQFSCLQKLKKDLYNARAVLTSFKAATRGTGGGKAPEEPRKSHPHFAPLFDILETTVAVKGIINSETAFLEYDAQLTQEETKQKEMKIEEEAKVKGFDCEDAKISVLDLKPSITTPKMAPRKLLNSFTRSNTTKRAHKLVENVNEERTRLLRLEQESAMLKNQKLRLECMLLKKQLLRVDLGFQERYGYIPVVAGETNLQDSRDTNDGIDINFTEKINIDINKYEEQDEDVEDEFIEVEED